MGRCLRTSVRSPLAPLFCAAIETLYRLPVEPRLKKECHKAIDDLRHSLWPILIDCRIQYKMYTEALDLLDTYLKVKTDIKSGEDFSVIFLTIPVRIFFPQSGGLMPQHFTSSVIQLGLECERIDLVRTGLDRGRPLHDIHQYMRVSW